MLLLRALLLSAFVALALTSNSAINRKKREATSESETEDPDFWSPYSSAYAGSYAGPGFGWPWMMPPMYYSRPSFFPFWPVMNFQPMTPWYKGPNVCTETKYADEPAEFREMAQNIPRRGDVAESQKSCHGTDEYYICKGSKMNNGEMKQYMTMYKCCHGFVRSVSGKGCTEIDVKNLMPALRDLGAVRFVELSEQVGMDVYLDSGNFTVFCPTNFAVDHFLKDLDDKEKQAMSYIDKNQGQFNLSEVVSSHLARGFFRLDDFDDEKVLKAAKPGACIRINTYYTPHKVVTANCVPITSENNFARNGIIHRIERVLPIPSRTVADIVAADAQFSMLKSLLSRAGLVQFLRNRKGNFTLFAPTDAALTSQISVLEKLYNESQCISSVVKNHILGHVICSSAIPRQAHSINIIGELMTLTWNVDRKLYVDDVQVVVRDIIGTNGVVHIIDGVLIPGQAKSVVQRLEESGIVEFTDLLELAGLKPTFDNMRNVTFFIPDDDSIRNTPKRILENIRSREKLKEVLLYHVAISQIETLNVKNSQTFRTNLGSHNVRISQYVTYPYLTKQATVQCANILSPDNWICGGVLHVIDRLLLPPKRNIVAALEDMPEFHTLFMLLRRTGFEDRMRKDEETFTLLAPTEDAFHQLGSNFISEIMRDRSKGTDFLKMHILPGTICCGQLRNIYDAGRQQTRSIDGSLLSVRVSPKGSIIVGEAKIVECDTATENGVIHIIDGFVDHFKSQMKSNILPANLLP